MNAGGGALMHGEDVETILEILRNYFQPDALGLVLRRKAKQGW